MKKIEDFKDSRCKYEGMKVFEEGFTKGRFCVVVYASNENLIAVDDEYGDECIYKIGNRPWFIYEEPRQTVLEPYLIHNSSFDFKIVWMTKNIGGGSRKVTPEELASGKIVLED